jgi:hypothetical protein
MDCRRLGAAGFANYAVSPSGSLVYQPHDPALLERQLVWLDRKGVARSVTEARRAYGPVRVSPDGRRLATSTFGSGMVELWSLDLTRNAWDRLSAAGIDWYPVWSPDGTTLIVETQAQGKGLDIAAVPFEGQRSLRFVLQTAAHERGGRLSPDGRWMAYESDESGRPEVYVLPYPGLGGRWQVSTEGGSVPVWSRDGRELFFKSGDRLMVAGVETRPAFRTGLPTASFDLMPRRSGDWGVATLEEYDSAPDGRLVMVRATAPATAPALAVVLGWSEEVARRLAAGR